MTSCVSAQSAKGWEFGDYRKFTPTPSIGVPTSDALTDAKSDAPVGGTIGAIIGRSASGARPVGGAIVERFGTLLGPGLRLSRVAVQRPQVAPGEAVKLIAEYEISGLGTALLVPVKETRVIRFEGQHVATLERVVLIPRGKRGSSLVLKVPTDAAPGFYTVTTTVEPRDTESGSSMSRANSIFRVGPAAASNPPAVSPAAVPTQFKLWTDKTSYRIGETLKVFFESSRDGYATLVNVETSGRITILYPNAYRPNHAVKAGQTYSVPDRGDPYELRLGGPEGVKLVYALFTTTPMRFVEESLIKNSVFGPENDRAEAITRDINFTVKRISLEEQASAVLEIEVTP